MKMADGDANQLGRQDLINESSSEDEGQDEMNQVDHLKVGSYYELDHSRLPPNAPIQLQAIRIVMVCSKNGGGLTVRYPSTFALKSHFKVAGGVRRSGGSLQLNLSPAMDEKYTMGFRVAAEALFKRIRPDEYVEGRGLWRFWTATGKGRAARVETRPSKPFEAASPSLVYQRGATKIIRSKSGECLSALSSGRVLKWGKRQRVRFEAPRGGGEDLGNPILITPPLNGEEKEKGKESEDGGSDDAGEAEEDGVEELDVKHGVKPLIQLRRNRKRKCKVVNYNLQAKKKSKKQNKEGVVVKRKLGLSTTGQKQNGRKESICRWSKDRYKLAEENMLKIMKAEGASIHKPVMRQTLRDEARKQIGDTGLLDHLLKHMAGKVAPGGAERFRRRHNAEGTMEYWLESSDLVEIRKQAGVSDPYWMPKPGWKLGDNPSQDPACALKIKQLEDELENVKRDVQELLTIKPAEQDIVATTGISSLTDHVSTAHEIGVHPLKELQEELLMRKSKLEKQMIKVSQDLAEMEEEIEKHSKVDRTSKLLDSEEGEALATHEGSEKKDTDGPDQDISNRSVEVVVPSSGKVAGTMTAAEAAAARAEEKAAFIERLKSGFRICKPKGTFLWPSMVVTSAADSPDPNSSMTSSSQVFSSTTPTENHLLAAQTPPSVSSTITKSPSLSQLPQPAPPPVKPLAKRHGSAVFIPASTALYDQVAARMLTTTPTTLSDLNHAPATNTLQNDSIRFYGGTKSNTTFGTIGHRQDYYNQSFSMVGSNSDLQSLHNQIRMGGRIPKLEAAETNCIPVSADQQKHKKPTSAANASPSSMTAGATNTWRPVPSPGRLIKNKLNQ